MKFGVFLLTQRHDDPAASLSEIERQAERIEELGFDSLWVGEHHFTDEVFFDPFQMLSYLSHVTSDITLGTAVTLVPLYNPVQLAERTANLDVLSNGRFVFGAGVGYRPKEFEVFGVDRSERGIRMTETLTLLEKLWVEDDVSFSGRVFEFEDVSVNPKPIQENGPDVWIGAKAPAALRRAARQGDAWFIPPTLPLSEVETAYEHYREYVDESDREPKTSPIWREVFVAESAEKAEELAREHLENKYSLYAEWDNESGVDDGAFQADQFVLGSPEQVREQIETLQRQFGIDHFIIRSQWPGMDTETALSSFELFADEVMPHFS